MENKKLLKYLLKDLVELDEMFATEHKTHFDEMELEFIRNRVSGARKLVKLYLEKEEGKEKKVEKTTHENVKNHVVIEREISQENITAANTKNVESIVSQVAGKVIAEDVEKNESKTEPETLTTAKGLEAKEETIKAEAIEEVQEETLPEIKEEISIRVNEELADESEKAVQKDESEDVQYEEELVDVKGKRLGDSFFKEKSVNDSMSDDFSKLEHKLSNRPVASIKTSIGINDKFQYIRELFEGSAENFTNAVEELDAMNNLKDAVQYLQTNYKWKKNETSLKFVNLIKRRFSNE